MQLCMRKLSTRLLGIGTPHSNRAILMQCFINMRSYCAARTPSFILRSRNSASLALVSLESGVAAMGSFKSRLRRLCSGSHPFLAGVTSLLYRHSKWASVVALGAETFVSPASILASMPRTQTTASFLWVNVLLTGVIPSRLTCAWNFPFLLRILPSFHLPCDCIVTRAWSA